MSLSIGAKSQVLFGNQNSKTVKNSPVTNNNSGSSYSNDSLNLRNNITNNQTPPSLPTEAGAMKKVGDWFGSIGSNIADALGFGETAEVIAQEYQQVDFDRSGTLNHFEFNSGSLNIFDFMGTEFRYADKNNDGGVDKSEYKKYRKEQLGRKFEVKDSDNDRHLTMGEVGSIGQFLLANQDPSLDPNRDGLVNKREFIRSNVRTATKFRNVLMGG